MRQPVFISLRYRSRFGLGSALLEPSTMRPRGGFFRRDSRISRSLETLLSVVKIRSVKPAGERMPRISVITPG